MVLLHGNTATRFTYVFHGRQFIFAHVLGVCFGNTAEAAIFRLAAWVTQMPRLIRNRTTIFTGISHINSSFSMSAKKMRFFICLILSLQIFQKPCLMINYEKRIVNQRPAIRLKRPK